MASDGRMDGQTEGGGMDGLTDEAAAICSPFGKHNKCIKLIGQTQTDGHARTLNEAFKCTPYQYGDQMCPIILKSIHKYRIYGPDNPDQ